MINWSATGYNFVRFVIPFFVAAIMFMLKTEKRSFCFALNLRINWLCWIRNSSLRVFRILKNRFLVLYSFLPGYGYWLLIYLVYKQNLYQGVFVLYRGSLQYPKFNR